MAKLPARNLPTELQRYFWGTPEQRILAALRLGDEVLALFLGTQPPGTTREAARRLLQRNGTRGRRRSAAIDALNQWTP